MGQSGHVAHREGINAYNILVGKPQGKRPLGRPRHRWESYIRLDLSQIEWKVLDWMHLAWDRYQWRTHVNTVMNLRIP